jgi:hypothetical protein
MRAISPGGAVRFGAFGNLSTTSSANASTVKITTEATEPMSDYGPSILSQPRCAAHAVTAGAVSERRPLNNPMRKARSSVMAWSSFRHQFSLYLRRRALSLPLLLLMPATFGLGSRCSPTCARSKVDWSQQFLRSNGKVTHALPGCVEHSVRDGGRDPNQSKFADPFAG